MNIQQSEETKFAFKDLQIGDVFMTIRGNGILIKTKEINDFNCYNLSFNNYDYCIQDCQVIKYPNATLVLGDKEC